MLLHHMVTIMLYFYSYYNYFHKFGSLVMFLHDWADITTSFMKAIYETEYNSIIYLNAFANLLIWGYSRLVAYPCLIFYGMIYNNPVLQAAVAIPNPTLEQQAFLATLQRIMWASDFFLLIL